MRITKTPVDALQFVERVPRSTHQSSRVWGPVEEKAKEHPGQWALIATDASLSLARRFRRIPGFQASVKNAPRGQARGDIWIRYVGEDPR